VVRERGVEASTPQEDEREAAFRAGCRAVLKEGRIERGDDGLFWRPPR
jgi:hypothetical protein